MREKYYSNWKFTIVYEQTQPAEQALSIIKVSKQLNVLPVAFRPASGVVSASQDSKIHKKDIYLSSLIITTLLTLSSDDQLKIRKHYIAPTLIMHVL